VRFIVLEPGMEPYRKHTDDAGYDLKSRINVNVFPDKLKRYQRASGRDTLGCAGLIRQGVVAL